MKITCDHANSQHGLPVILDSDGQVMDYAPGMTAALKQINWTRDQLAKAAGYKSGRSIEKFWQGLPPSAQLLNVLALEIQRRKQ